METQTTQYGAPELKKVYKKNLRRGLEYAVICYVVIIGTFLTINYFNSAKADNIPVWNKPIDLINIPIPPPIDDGIDQPPPPKPPENVSQPPKQLDVLTPNPVSSDKAEIQTILTQHKLDSMTSFVSGNDTGKYVYNGNGNDNGIKPDIHLPDKVIKHTDDVTNVPLNLGDVDVPPECLNLQQVKATLVYPPMAKDIGKTGKVNVKILVGTDGKVIKIADINGPDVFYDEV